MNVLYIADPNSIHDIRWIKAFADSGVNCFIVPRKTHSKVEKEEFPFTLLAPIPDPSVVNFFREIKGVCFLKRIIIKHKIDLVHILYAEPNVLWVRYKFMLNIPFIITTRGSDVLRTIPSFFSSKGLLNREVARRYKKAFKMADLITCTSLNQQAAISLIEVSSFDKIKLIRTGVDLNAVVKANENIASYFGIQKPIILMPRKLKPVYNHEFTLEAIRLLPAKIKLNYTFVFVNGDGLEEDYILKIKTLAKEITADIRFLPTLSHNQMLSLYKQSMLAIMNPLSDGSPVSAMEAMASGLPVVLGPLNYDREIFFDTSTILKGWDASELASVIVQLLALSAEARSVLTQKAQRRVESSADGNLEMRKIVNYYDRLCN